MNSFEIGEVYKAKTPGFYACVIGIPDKKTVELIIWTIRQAGWYYDSCIMCPLDNPGFPSSCISTGGDVDLIFSAADVLQEQEKALFRLCVTRAPVIKNAASR